MMGTWLSTDVGNSLIVLGACSFMDQSFLQFYGQEDWARGKENGKGKNEKALRQSR